MKFLVLLLTFCAVAYVIGGYFVRYKNRKCPEPIINNVPYVRTFIEEQEQPSYVMTMYKNMFWGLNPWNDTHAHKVHLKVGKKQPFAHGERPKNILVGEDTNRDDYLNTFFG